MNRQKAYIYGRVTPFSSKLILDYQMNELIEFAQLQNLDIEKVSYSIGVNLFDEEHLFEEIMTYIKNELINVFVIWSPLRITDELDLYEEFEMYCMKHHVKILTYKN